MITRFFNKYKNFFIFIMAVYTLYAFVVYLSNYSNIYFLNFDLLSVSKAYHLGQEETDWFEKPRSSSRHYGSSHSSGRRHGVKHTYHDYDEPPEEYCPQDEYSKQSLPLYG